MLLTGRMTQAGRLTYLDVSSFLAEIWRQAHTLPVEWLGGLNERYVGNKLFKLIQSDSSSTISFSR